MKVYRIVNKTRDNRVLISHNNNGGCYEKLSSAKKALAQYKNRWYFRKFELVIMEYELTNEKEIN